MEESQQKEQLSLAYLHAVTSAAGYVCYLPLVDDDSIDRTIAAAGKVRGILESPRIDVQLKSTVRSLGGEEAYLTFRLKRKNYDDLRRTTMVPRLLVVLLLPRERHRWVEQTHEQLICRHAAYFLSLHGLPAEEGKASVTVKVPRKNLFSATNLRRLMAQASHGKRKLS